MKPFASFRLFVAVLVVILTLLTTSVCAVKQPTSYCKCICFQNSTIIPLNSPPSQADSPSPPSRLLGREEAPADNGQEQHHRTLTCNDCNRAFCLDYKLPICKNAKEEDVFAQCFQRDSLKDRTIVTLFLVATASLLGWALIKPFVIKSGVGEVMQKYTPIGLNDPSERENGNLPGPNGSGSSRPGRTSGRGSISRQGGLNS